VWVTASDSSGPTTPSPSDSTTQKHSNIVFSAAMIVPAANGHQKYILNSQNLPDVQAQETSFSTTNAVRCMLGSLPTAVQSLCHKGEKLRRRISVVARMFQNGAPAFKKAHVTFDAENFSPSQV
jgi:hypothetical protein